MRAAVAVLALILSSASPALAQSALQRAGALIDAGRYAEAQAAADEALKAQLTDADKSAALLARGRAKAGLGDCKAALPDLESARQLYPGADVHGDLGDCDFALGDWAGAIDHLRQDMRRNPSNISRVRIGQALMELARFDEAEDTLKAALAVDPADADAVKALAELRKRRAAAPR